MVQEAINRIRYNQKNFEITTQLVVPEAYGERLAKAHKNAYVPRLHFMKRYWKKPGGLLYYHKA